MRVVADKRLKGNKLENEVVARTSERQDIAAFPRTTNLAPRHTTHRGGKGEPFHDWYPYLEGFSSEFVKHVLAQHIPNARLIIDPFAGTGTTPVVLSSLGLDCGYCEINPAMQLVIQSKMSLGQLTSAAKAVLAEKLVGLSVTLPKLVADAPPDESLEVSYHANFRGSIFFSPPAYRALLCLRTVADTLSNEDALLANLLTVSVMSKIVICSKLKRAGDVRYKTEKELAKGVPDIVSEVAQHLLVIANDCETSLELNGTAALLVPNAKELNLIKPILADGVITSPPYLNGTNYFRNTKLELWFARFLTIANGLRAYRDQAITSGINDVGAAQGRVLVNDAVSSLVSNLSANAYDQRIPRMVAGYFEDMSLVILGLARNCKPGACICIDIGDSRYAGVHVPTHDILAQIGVGLGLEHVGTTRLRERLSKDKSTLSQSLVVLRKAIKC